MMRRIGMIEWAEFWNNLLFGFEMLVAFLAVGCLCYFLGEATSREVGESEKKAVVFVEHIEQHLKEMGPTEIGEDRQVICKICDKTIDRIWREYQNESSG
jgi:hypothetical protein